MPRTGGLVAAAMIVVVSLASGCAAQLANLDADDPDERREAVLELADRALRQRDPAFQVTVAERARKLIASDPNPAVRGAAIEAARRLAIAGTQPREAAQAFSDTLVAYKEEHVRPEAAAFLRLVAVEALASTARHAPGDEATKQAISKEAIDSLRRALFGDDDRDVRIACARELGELKADEAKGELVRALRDETPDVRYHAQRSLVKITGVDKGPTFEDWERWLKKEGGG